MLLGFSAMLHPGELILLCRRDLVFPSDVANDMACMFIHLQNPKTARFARRQHARIDDSQVIRLAEAAFGRLDLRFLDCSLGLWLLLEDFGIV